VNVLNKNDCLFSQRAAAGRTVVIKLYWTGLWGKIIRQATV